MSDEDIDALCHERTAAELKCLRDEGETPRLNAILREAEALADEVERLTTELGRAQAELRLMLA